MAVAWCVSGGAFGMTVTQTEIVARLAELSRLLDKATVEIAELDEAAVRAKSTYETTFARAFLQADGPMDARKQIAVLAAADQRLAMELAEAQHRACRERIKTLGVQIDVGRSMSAALRQQFQAEAVGQWT